MEELLQKMQKDSEKVEKTIDSCKTVEHLESFNKFLDLFYKKWATTMHQIIKSAKTKEKLKMAKEMINILESLMKVVDKKFTRHTNVLRKYGSAVEAEYCLAVNKDKIFKGEILEFIGSEYIPLVLNCESNKQNLAFGYILKYNEGLHYSLSRFGNEAYEIVARVFGETNKVI